MRFVHYYPRAISDLSGVTAALWSWAAALARVGHDVVVLHAGGTRRVEPPVTPGLSEIAIAHAGHGRTTWAPIALERYLRPDDVVVLHEGWVLSNLVAARAASRAGVRYVIVPHGAYEPGVRRRLKPIVLVRAGLERQVLERAFAVHVFFDSEVDTIRRLAPRARCMVAPTGFDVPNARWSGDGDYLAWLGRYDLTHKGVDLLLAALATLPAAARPHVVLRGYDFRRGLREARGLVAGLDLAPWVTAAGEVSGADKVAFLTKARGYVHPSRWESHSIALLESLALGVPTLASSTMHIAPELMRARAAIVVQPVVPEIAAGFARLSAAGPALGQRGRDFIAERFSWERALAQFAEGLDRLSAP